VKRCASKDCYECIIVQFWGNGKIQRESKQDLKLFSEINKIFCPLFLNQSTHLSLF
jgi:hypothetical protein